MTNAKTNVAKTNVETIKNDDSKLIATRALQNTNVKIDDKFTIENTTTNVTIRRNATRMFIDHSNCTHERNSNERAKCRRAIERARANNDA